MTAAALAVAMSLDYTAGMFLNDYFDRAHDAREQPHRPIPSGQANAPTVLAIGLTLLAVGTGVVAGLALGPQGRGWPPAAAALALALAIVAYDVHHKQNPLSPVLMALCRVLVYATAALSAAAATPALALGASVLFTYLLALTWLAKNERRLPFRVPVGTLVAGISLVDAALAVAHDRPEIAALCMACFPLTLAFQRRVAGT
jgi:4-hydroxybenzoate polyprenyltransferase